VVQYDLPETIRVKGAVTTNKNAGFGSSIPERFHDLGSKKKLAIPGPGRYFESPRGPSPDDERSYNESDRRSRALMHSVIEKNKYSSLEASGSQLDYNDNSQDRSPTTHTKATALDKKSMTRE
jgi:hypothetical protein